LGIELHRVGNRVTKVVVSETGFEIVVLLVSRPVKKLVVEAKEINKHDFIPDRRIYTFRLSGKPSLGNHRHSNQKMKALKSGFFDFQEKINKTNR
jgi:cobalamin-dependent methionine synthase I